MLDAELTAKAYLKAIVVSILLVFGSQALAAGGDKVVRLGMWDIKIPVPTDRTR